MLQVVLSMVKVPVIRILLSTHDGTVLNILDWDYVFCQKQFEASSVFPSPPFPVIMWFEMTSFPMSVPSVHCICIFLWNQPNLWLWWQVNSCAACGGDAYLEEAVGILPWSVAAVHFLVFSEVFVSSWMWHSLGKWFLMLKALQAFRSLDTSHPKTQPLIPGDLIC